MEENLKELLKAENDVNNHDHLDQAPQAQEFNRRQTVIKSKQTM